MSKLWKNYDNLLQIIFKIFNKNAVNNKTKDKTNNESMTLDKIKSKMVITTNSSYKLIFFNKKKILKQSAINRRANYTKLKA